CPPRAGQPAPSEGRAIDGPVPSLRSSLYLPSDRADVASRRTPSFERSPPCHPRSPPSTSYGADPRTRCSCWPRPSLATRRTTAHSGDANYPDPSGGSGREDRPRPDEHRRAGVVPHSDVGLPVDLRQPPLPAPSPELSHCIGLLGSDVENRSAAPTQS